MALAAVAGWVAEQRDFFASPKGYTLGLRASYAIVDAFHSENGEMAKALRDSCHFTSVIAFTSSEVSSSSSTAAAVTTVATLSSSSVAKDISRWSTHPKGRTIAELVYRNDEDFEDWFRNKYSLEASDSILFLDFLARNAWSCERCMSFIKESLQNHSCPMIILKVSDEFNYNLIRELKPLLRERRIAQNIVQGQWIIMVAGHCKVEVASSRVSSVAGVAGVRSTGLPTPKTRAQLRALFEMSKSNDQYLRGMYLRLRQIISSKLYGLSSEADQLWSLVDSMLKQNIAEERVLMAVRHKYHNEMCRDKRFYEMQFGENPGRANSRVTDIQTVLPKGFTPTSLLDIGCAEGSITSVVGAAFNINECERHGVDVRDVPEAAGFVFHKLAEAPGEALPLPTDSVDLCIALMTFHHIPNVEHTMREINRILKPNGILVLREHHCDRPEMSVVLDMMHNFYSTVWAEPMEMPYSEFCDTYQATYRPREEWTSMLDKAGFEHVIATREAENAYFRDTYTNFQKGYVKNPFGYYTACYRVKGNSEGGERSAKKQRL